MSIKQITAVILVLLLALSLCACGTEPTESNSVSKEQTEQPSAESEKVEQTGWMETGSPVEGGENLTWVSNDLIASGSGQSLMLFGDKILVTESVNPQEQNGANTEEAEITISDYRLSLLNPKTGEAEAECVIPDTVSPQAFVTGDRITVVDDYSGKVYRLTGQLEWEDTCETGKGQWEWTCFPGTDGDMLYAVSFSDGILSVDLSDGETSTVADGLSDAWVSARSGSRIVISYTDPESGTEKFTVLNLETGMLEEMPVGAECQTAFCFGDTWAVQLKTFPQVVYIGTADDYGALVLSDSADAPSFGLSFDDRNSRLLVSEFNEGVTEQTFTLYGSDGTALSECMVPVADGYLSSEWVWSEQYGGYFAVYTAYAASSGCLYFWDISGGTDAADLEWVPSSDFTADPETGAVNLDDFYAQAEAMTERYGITVRTGAQAATEYNDYQTELCTDYWAVRYGLQKLDSILASFPDGFFPQLCLPCYEGIEINLTGSLLPLTMPENNTGFSDFQAFVQYTGSNLIMAVDISTGTDLTGTYYHEFSHMIDNRLSYVAGEDDSCIFSEEMWRTMSPDDLDYCYSYYDIPQEYYEQDYYSYFIDMYSRTFPTEDRARILEYACTQPSWFTDREGLLTKLLYYSDCIRSGFDTTDWPDTVLWEKALDDNNWRYVAKG